MASRKQGAFGKPKIQRTESREIEPSAATPEPITAVREQVLVDDNATGNRGQSGGSTKAASPFSIGGGDDWPRLALTDEQYHKAAPFLRSGKSKRGPRTYNNRLTLEGILYYFRTGIPWRDLPPYFGKWNTVHRTFQRWCERGVFLRLFTALAKELDFSVLAVDGTFFKVHQHATGARKNGRTPEESRVAQAIGVSRGGLTTKLMALMDRKGKLAGYCFVPGNAAETHQLGALLDAVPVNQVDYLLADRAFDTDAVRDLLWELQIESVIPPKSNRKMVIYYNRGLYKGRHLVENGFGDYKQYRGIATRYCKLIETFAGAFQLVAWHIQTKRRKQRGSKHLENVPKPNAARLAAGWRGPAK